MLFPIKIQATKTDGISQKKLPEQTVSKVMLHWVNVGELKQTEHKSQGSKPVVEYVKPIAHKTQTKIKSVWYLTFFFIDVNLYRTKWVLNQNSYFAHVLLWSTKNFERKSKTINLKFLNEKKKETFVENKHFTKSIFFFVWFLLSF